MSFTMATPQPVYEGETIEQYLAKLVKSNSVDLEKNFRKVFPEVTGEQITALGRQGLIEKLVESRKSERAIPSVSAVVPGQDPTVAQLIQMMLAQQKAAEVKEEKRLASEMAERKAAEAERKAEQKAAEERLAAEKKAAEEKEEIRLAFEKAERKGNKKRT